MSRRWDFKGPETRKQWLFSCDHCVFGSHFRLPDTLRPDRGQPLAVLVEIDQRKGGQQPFVIFLDASIAYLRVVEYALQDSERPLHSGAHP